MQQPAGGGAGPQYRVPPDMAQMLGIQADDNLPPPSPTSQHVIQSKHGQPEAASPISSRPPAARNFDELVPPAATAAAGFPDEDALAGEEAERGPPGNRWPRQETVALLKIRSDMDAAFRDASLKGPLWEEVSRQLGEMGYNRSAKKCKEKFENVHKYYKRTKEGRAGRQDGKSYRFFSQLEALHSGGGGSGLSVSPTALIPAATFQPPLPATPISVGNPMAAPGRIQTTLPPIAGPSQFPPVVLPAGISFSTSSEEEGEEDESEEEEGTEAGGRKRKRAGGGGGGSSKKMMSFFEGLIRQLMERQEAMQQRFLETIEKREQDRMIREEAWKRQEMARLTREHEVMAQERAMAASRDSAVIGFLQKITGQTIPTQTASASAAAVTITTTLPPPTPPSTVVTQPLLHPIHTISFQQHAHDNIIPGAAARRHPPPPSTSTADAAADQEQRVEPAAGMAGSFDPAAASSSRWPKAEVHALIKLRSGLEAKYLESGPKGPLWEEISAEMRRIGYNRSSKRCKEKWENINKYFKKVKESNKKRPEDAKTCPYFHQLDALYKKKLVGGAAGSSAGQTRQDHQGSVSSIISPPLPQSGAKDKNNNMSNNSSSNKASAGGHDGGSNAGSNVQIQTSNGDIPPSFFQEDPAAIKKPEDIMKELMEQQQQSVMDDYDSDNLEVEDDDDELDGGDDEEEKNDEKMAYKIQFQRQGPAGSSSNGGGGNVGASPTATSAGSFLAVVQ